MNELFYETRFFHPNQLIQFAKLTLSTFSLTQSNAFFKQARITYSTVILENQLFRILWILCFLNYAFLFSEFLQSVLSL